MPLTNQEAEFEPQPAPPQPVLEGLLAALLECQAIAEGAYSRNTLRAQKAGASLGGLVAFHGQEKSMNFVDGLAVHRPGVGTGLGD
jgi:hypothetical protein